MKILLIDDSKVSLLRARSILDNSDVDCKILISTSGREALDMLKKEKIDVVLLDIVMPDLDGLEVLQQIKAQPEHQDVQVLMLTGLKDRDSLVRSFELGAVDYISKPMDETEFVTRVRAAVRTRREILVRKRSEDALRTIFNSVYDAIFIHRRDGTVIDVNDKMLEMYGVDRDQAVKLSILQDYSSPDSPLNRLPRLWAKALAGENQFFEWKARRPNSGTVFTVEVFLTKLDLDDEQVVLATVRDITERKQAEEQLRYLSLHDSLTGLYNRTYFEEQMRRLEGGRDEPVSLIIADVDGLKLVNDTLGHGAGDVLLRGAAGLLRKSFRKGDVVARIGGDEFAVLLPRMADAVIEKAVQSLRQKVAGYTVEELGIPLHMSLGHATRADASVALEQVFRDADDAMYREKLQHREEIRKAIMQALSGAAGRRSGLGNNGVARHPS